MIFGEQYHEIQVHERKVEPTHYCANNQSIPQ